MKIKQGPEIRPPRIVIHGDHKVGKTTFAAGAPSPIFLQTEEGADVVGADRFDLCTTLKEVQEHIRELLTEEHSYKTIVIDSADWLERVIHGEVAKAHGVPSIDGIGYGKGYASACDHFAKILQGLDVLRAKRGMASIVICHSEIKRFDSPEVDPYDRYQLKLHKSAAALLGEWADVIGFACEETFIKNTDIGFDKKVSRAISRGKRVLRLQGAPAYVAGNRFGLPATIDLDWQSFQTAFTESAKKEKGQ